MSSTAGPRLGHDQHASVEPQHVDVVAVELCEDLGSDDLVGRPAGRPPAGQIDDPIHHRQERVHLVRRQEDRDVLVGGQAMQQCDDLLHALGSRFASGSSSSNNFGWLTRAWAISTRCCSPPERLPTRLFGEPLGVDGMEHLVDPLALVLRASPDPEPVPVDAESHEIAGAHRHVRIQQHLLRDVPERSAPPYPRRAEDADLAGARALKAEDHAQQGRLPDAV